MLFRSVGVAFISAGLQGYLLGFGRIGEDKLGLVSRGCVVIAGLALVTPAGGLYGFSQTILAIVCVIFLAAGMGITLLQRKRLLPVA